MSRRRESHAKHGRDREGIALRFTNGIFLAAPLALLLAGSGRAQDQDDGWRRVDPPGAAPAVGESGSRAPGMDEPELRRRAPGTRSRAEEILERLEKSPGGKGATQRPAPAKRKDAPARAKDLPASRKDALKNYEDEPGKPRDAAARRQEFLSNPRDALAKPRAVPAKPKDPPARPKAAAPGPKPPPPAPAATPKAGKEAQIKELEDQLAKLKKAKAPPPQIQAIEVRLANLRRAAGPDPRAGVKARKY